MSRDNVWMHIMLIIVAALAAVISVININLTPDSMTYALASQQIISGNGISVPLIRITDNDVPVNGLVPMLMYPPLFPIFLAALGGVTPQSFFAAQILNVVCHVLIAVFTFLLVKHLSGKIPGLTAGMLVSLSFPLLSNSHYIWSETLFIALTMAAVYFSVVSRNSEGHQGRCLITAGVCASAAILTRYSGIALIGVLLWTALVLIRNGKIKKEYISVIISVVLPVLTVFMLFFYNFMVSGKIRGYKPPLIERSYLTAFNGTFEMILMQFKAGGPIFIFVAFFALYIFINSYLRKEALKYFNSGMDLMIVFIISYTALIGVSMAQSQPNFEIRYMSPLVPLLLSTSICFIALVFNRIKDSGRPRTALYGMIFSFGILAYGSCYNTVLNFPDFLKKNDTLHSILKSCAYKWTIDNYGKDTIIATNNPFNLSFFGGYSTVFLPRERWFNKNHPGENIESVLANNLSGLKAQVLVLFNEMNAPYYGNYLENFFAKREDRDKFILAHVCPDGVVYSVKEQD